MVTIGDLFVSWRHVSGADARRCGRAGAPRGAPALPHRRASAPLTCRHETKRSPMVTICLDPQQYHNRMTVVEELRHTAELGYSHMELSPRADWFFWHQHPTADSAMIAEAVKAQQETGVSIHTLVPVFNWSSP